jgi:hypothetical protein
MGGTVGVNKPAPSGDRPELRDTVVADADVPIVEVDGRVAVAGDEANLVAAREPVDGGGPESKANALRPASTIARSSVGRLITVAQTNRLGSKLLVGAPSRSRLRPIIGVHRSRTTAYWCQGPPARHRRSARTAFTSRSTSFIEIGSMPASSTRSAIARSASAGCRRLIASVSSRSSASDVRSSAARAVASD